MIYNGSVWSSWRKIMGKTFDEWWEENKADWCNVMNRLPNDLQAKAIARITWAASRENMTVKDI